MKRLLSTVTAALVIGVLTLSAVADDTPDAPRWEPLAPMPLGVFSAGLSISDGKVVITGGMSQIGHLAPAVQVYDPKANKWSAGPSLISGRKDHAQITLADGRILVVGGDRGDMSEGFHARADGEIIDLTKGTTTAIADAPRAMRDNTIHLLKDGRVLVVGPLWAHIYDPPTDTWKWKFKLRQERKAHASVMLPDGQVLVGGGFGRDTFELIDPQLRVSKLLRIRLPMPLDDLAMTLLPDGRIWVTGGQRSSGDTVDGSWIIDLSGDLSKSTPGPTLKVAGGMADHVAAIVGDKLVIAGGETQSRGSDTELTAARLLDPDTLEVTSLPDMARPHDDAVAAVVDGCFVVFGGYRVTRIAGKVPVPTAAADVERLVLPRTSQASVDSADNP